MRGFYCKVLCIIKNKNKILVHKVEGSLDGSLLYRTIGGTIEFGEHAIDTLRREMKEELNSEIINVRFVKVIENIFDYKEKGKIFKVHEIDFVYTADLKNKRLYGLDSIKIADKKSDFAIWIDIEEFKKGKAALVPKAIIAYI